MDAAHRHETPQDAAAYGQPDARHCLFAGGELARKTARLARQRACNLLPEAYSRDRRLGVAGEARKELPLASRQSWMHSLMTMARSRAQATAAKKEENAEAAAAAAAPSK